MRFEYAGIYAFSASAIKTGNRVAEELLKKPWLGPDGYQRSSTVRYLPPGLAPFAPPLQECLSPVCIFASIRKLLAEEFLNAWAHIFIGATGIAVRAIAPFVSHKSKDPPVIVIDPAARYVISLLSGHWGGANSLALHIANILKAQAVLSTASEVEGQPSLDLHMRKAALKILDWPVLATFQGRILRGERLPLYDPGGFLNSPAWLKGIGEDEVCEYSPLIAVDWKRRRARAELLRAIPPLFCLGFGFRKGVVAEEILSAFQEMCATLNLAYESVALCATVEEKAQDPEAQKFAELLNIRLESMGARDLATIRTPNPSRACGRRFSLQPFSVCESAALAGAGTMSSGNTHSGRGEGQEPPVLYAQKFIFNKKITMALALPGALWKRIKPSGGGESPACP